MDGVSVIETRRLMMCLVITGFCSENYLKHAVGSMQNHSKVKADRTLTIVLCSIINTAKPRPSDILKLNIYLAMKCCSVVVTSRDFDWQQLDRFWVAALMT
jgi:hypothetical protein